MFARNPCVERGCSACCHDTEMPLTDEDVARLVALGHALDAFSVVDDEGWRRLRTVEPSTPGAPRPCFFLRDGLCGVYEARPEGCRIYPFVATPEGRMVRDEDCPFRREFVAPPGTARRLGRVVSRLESQAASRRLL